VCSQACADNKADRLVNGAGQCVASPCTPKQPTWCVSVWKNQGLSVLSNIKTTTCVLATLCCAVWLQDVDGEGAAATE
jgi:hypothetical protein